MRPPTDKEKLVCPKSGEELVPDLVYEVQYKGQKGLLRGIVPKHHHGGKYVGFKDSKECEWSGVPVPMRKPKR